MFKAFFLVVKRERLFSCDGKTAGACSRSGGGLKFTLAPLLIFPFLSPDPSPSPFFPSVSLPLFIFFLHTVKGTFFNSETLGVLVPENAIHGVKPP